MEPEQYITYLESLQLCNKLLTEMELDRERIVGCINGELRKAYLRANEVAENEVRKIRAQLESAAQG